MTAAELTDVMDLISLGSLKLKGTSNTIYMYTKLKILF